MNRDVIKQYEPPKKRKYGMIKHKNTFPFLFIFYTLK